MDGPNANERLNALPRRQVDRARLEEPVTETPEVPIPTTLSEGFPPGLVRRPSLELLARVRDGLQVLDVPAPSMWRGMWE